MDKTTVQVKGLKIAPPGGAGSIEELEEYINKLLEQLQGIADTSTKKKGPNSGFEQKWWNEDVGPASKDNKKLWDLERAARLRGFKSREAETLPPLRKPGSMGGLTSKFDEQVDILSGKFFPSPIADLSDIPEDFDTGLDPFEGKFVISRKVDKTDIKAVLDLMKPWKAPGWDFLPAGFLKACGKPLRVALAEVVECSFVLDERPKQFKMASIMVLLKAGKTPEEKALPGAYRSIALLSCMGKVIEKVISNHMMEAAETHGLLPKGQIGNRKGRSTEHAIRMVVKAVHTGWSYSAVATLMQLDIMGAFNAVVFTRLRHILWKKGYPMWIIRCMKSYTNGRLTKLFFDGKSQQPES
ncbi:Uu.00g118470.m01.CDS01 [Anthostomella pinea]|uniref:Uu.00g118470.m01.CDS01 n=1 Tax=Anthostomella pinea TaxID=933095 RepID=A0AAI8YEL7_9PEZI|nr:Uu.00g118470.m01.CDS01 [Anthostomella pinea]